MASQASALTAPAELQRLLDQNALKPSIDIWQALKEVADSIDAEIVPYEFTDNINGYSYPLDGQWIIALNKNLPDIDKEITLAHELAHVFHKIVDEVEADNHALDTVWSNYFKKLESTINSTRLEGALNLAVMELIVVMLKMLMLCPKMKTEKQREIAKAFLGMIMIIGISAVLFWLGPKIIKFVCSFFGRSK